MPQNIGVDSFPDTVGHFGAPDGHFRFCRRCGVAGGEQGPPAPLGGYFALKTLLIEAITSLGIFQRVLDIVG